jgi:hypothetical protein
MKKDIDFKAANRKFLSGLLELDKLRSEIIKENNANDMNEKLINKFINKKERTAPEILNITNKLDLLKNLINISIYSPASYINAFMLNKQCTFNLMINYIYATNKLAEEDRTEPLYEMLNQEWSIEYFSNKKNIEFFINNIVYEIIKNKRKDEFWNSGIQIQIIEPDLSSAEDPDESEFSIIFCTKEPVEWPHQTIMSLIDKTFLEKIKNKQEEVRTESTNIEEHMYESIIEQFYKDNLKKEPEISEG